VTTIVTVLVTVALLAGPARADDEANSILLVAKPELQDPNFAQTVVLVTRHRGGGAVGVVLNRPTATRLSEVFPARKELTGRPDVLFSGGPVSRGTLVLVFRSADRPANALRVLDDVYMSLDPAVFERIIAQPDGAAFHLYAGYAGWAPGQLEVEIHHGGWLVVEPDAGTLFGMAPDTMWPTLHERASHHGLQTDASGTPDLTRQIHATPAASAKTANANAPR
jgi:putative transcriptional regulator